MVKVALKGDALLSSPRFNKGTAFTSRERKQFDLLGRLPYQVDTLDQQCERAWFQVRFSRTGLWLSDGEYSTMITKLQYERMPSFRVLELRTGFYTIHYSRDI